MTSDLTYFKASFVKAAAAFGGKDMEGKAAKIQFPGQMFLPSKTQSCSTL